MRMEIHRIPHPKRRVILPVFDIDFGSHYLFRGSGGNEVNGTTSDGWNGWDLYEKWKLGKRIYFFRGFSEEGWII